MRSLVPSRRILGGVLAALCLTLAWQLGERRGLERAGTRTGDERAPAAPDESSVRGQDVRAGGAAAGPARESIAGDRTLEGRIGPAALAELRGERDMLRETVRSLRTELERADRLAVDERVELELYRRIGADETNVGLAIDTLERRAGDPATNAPAVLHVTLVQVRGRDRIDGTVEIVPLDENVGELPPESSGGVRAALADAPPAVWSAPFDLRFFETLEIPLGERFPPVVEVRVMPTAKSHAPFRARFRRDAIRILD